MLLRPRKHPRPAEEPVSPAEIAESLLAMGMMAWFVVPASFLWAPPLWVLGLMTPVERPAKAKVAEPVRPERVIAAQAEAPPAPPLATPVQAAPPAQPPAARGRPRPRRKEPR